MPTSQFGNAISALVAACQASTALAGVTIMDGPQPAMTAETDFIIVGHDGTYDSAGALNNVTEAVTYTQAWAYEAVPAPVKQENGIIRCVAASWTGDSNDLPGRRARVQVLIDACEDAALNAGDVGGIVFEGTTEAKIMYRQSGQGVAVMAAFGTGYSQPW